MLRQRLAALTGTRQGIGSVQEPASFWIEYAAARRGGTPDREWGIYMSKKLEPAIRALIAGEGRVMTAHDLPCTARRSSQSRRSVTWGPLGDTEEVTVLIPYRPQ